MNDTTKQMIKDVINSMCLPCVRRVIHFQYFVMTSETAKNDKTYWITEYLKEKRSRELNAPPEGCGICFGLLEKYSQTEYLTDVRLFTGSK